MGQEWKVAEGGEWRMLKTSGRPGNFRWEVRVEDAVHRWNWRTLYILGPGGFPCMKNTYLAF